MGILRQPGLTACGKLLWLSAERSDPDPSPARPASTTTVGSCKVQANCARLLRKAKVNPEEASAS